MEDHTDNEFTMDIRCHIGLVSIVIFAGFWAFRSLLHESSKHGGGGSRHSTGNTTDGRLDGGNSAMSFDFFLSFTFERFMLFWSNFNFSFSNMLVVINLCHNWCWFTLYTLNFSLGFFILSLSYFNHSTAGLNFTIIISDNGVSLSDSRSNCSNSRCLSSDGLIISSNFFISSFNFGFVTSSFRS